MRASASNRASSGQLLAGDEVPQITWPVAADPTEPEAGQVHLFCAALPEFKSQIRQFERFLSRAEIERATRFHFVKDRNSYIVRHALLRLILGRYLSVLPEELEFEYGEFGKPALKSSPVVLHFNTAYSSELVMFGITTLGPIGVDIERVHSIPEFEDIAAQYFCPQEAAMMRALPEERRMKAFYSCWTSKEAYLKATGEGIAESLNKVEVTLDSSLQGQTLHLPGDDPHGSWELHTFSPAVGYVGALAIKARISSLRLWRVPASLASTF
jgi:4'-phosphopantetheinyl transferase